jgi:hypothetical protein
VGLHQVVDPGRGPVVVGDQRPRPLDRLGVDRGDVGRVDVAGVGQPPGVQDAREAGGVGPGLGPDGLEVVREVLVEAFIAVLVEETLCRVGTRVRYWPRAIASSDRPRFWSESVSSALSVRRSRRKE